MSTQPGLVRRAVFSAVPPSSRPAAVSTTALAGFPTAGRGKGSGRYAILSTGNASKASRANLEPDLGSEARGPSVRGARDVTIMRVDLVVPAGANCLSFDFKFLSEEYPEFVGTDFNDAFVAELGRSDWNAGTKETERVTAPRNFATDRAGSYIAINRAGVTSMRAANAKGTTYDGATRRLRASTRTKPGLRRLYLSLFDQGDRIYDSAVFLDNLRTSRAKECKTGVLAAS
jgi:hypothetical protein